MLLIDIQPDPMDPTVTSTPDGRYKVFQVGAREKDRQTVKRFLARPEFKNSDVGGSWVGSRDHAAYSWSPVYAAFDKAGRCVATCGIEMWSHIRGRPITGSLWWAVAAESRGLGLGTTCGDRLLRRLEILADERKTSLELNAWIRPSNTKSVQLADRLGLVAVAQGNRRYPSGYAPKEVVPFVYTGTRDVETCDDEELDESNDRQSLLRCTPA